MAVSNLLALLMLLSLLAGSNAYAVSCPPPTPLNIHSSFTPDLPTGTNFTAFCFFSLSSAGGKPKVEWFRNSGSVALSHFASMHYDNMTLQTVLTIPNITVHDSDLYTARVSDRCGKASVDFNLKVDLPCTAKIPKPVGKLHNTLVVPESQHIQLTANYTGDLDYNNIMILWSKAGGGRDVCNKYQCNCTMEGICAFSCHLTILQPQVRDSGNYSVWPLTTDSADPSLVVFSVRVLPHPTLTRRPGRKLFANNSAHVELMYQLANVTEFVELVFVLNDNVVVNTTRDSKYRLKITHDPLNSENVTVSLWVPEQSPGDYKLCFPFSPVVTGRPSEVPCSPPSTVVRGAGDSRLLEIEVTVPVSAVVLAVLCGVCVGGVYHWRVRQARHRDRPECERPLLQSNQEVSSYGIDTEKDSPGGRKAVGRTGALQDLLRGCCGEDLSEQELQDIATDLADSATDISELGVRLLGSTRLMEEIRGQRGDSSYIFCLRVLEAWLDDTPTETARSRLVETVYHYRPELAAAIAENTLTT